MYRTYARWPYRINAVETAVVQQPYWCSARKVYITYQIEHLIVMLAITQNIRYGQVGQHKLSIGLSKYGLTDDYGHHYRRTIFY